MERFTVKIRTTNDAFESDAGYELAQILREVADKVQAGDRTSGVLYDSNGGLVGSFEGE